MNPAEPARENHPAHLRLFVYGTLKRGSWNHERFCGGALSVEEAVVRGRLYELPSGIPVLKVPEGDVLAHGTADPLADVATQARLSAASAPHPDPGGTGGPWGPVYGEVLTFDDPEVRLPAVDRLEGFRPGAPGLYRRVLVPARTRRGRILVWLYAVGRGEGPPGRPLPDGVWRG